jgi:hypothetical protein
MPVQATTVAALRSALQTRIEATTPTDTRTSEQPWRRMDRKASVAGSTRGYYLEISGQRHKVAGGWHTSSWATYDADLKIWTGYGALTDHHFEDAMSADMAQLLVRLSAVSGEITGFVGIVDEGWEDGDTSKENARWGAHLYRITYLLEQP